MTERGIGRISEFRRESGDEANGEVLVSQFLLFDKDFVGAYIIGVSEKASRRYQFMTLCNWDAMNVASGRSNAYISWMEYASADKLRWASEVVSSHRAILGRTKAFWVPYAAYYLLRERYYILRSEARSYVYSEDAPRWIKNAVDRYWTLVRYVHSERAPRWVKTATESYYALRHEYGYYALRYRYELARARREIRKSNTVAHTDRAVSEDTNA
jgi:hypothetical protein